MILYFLVAVLGLLIAGIFRVLCFHWKTLNELIIEKNALEARFSLLQRELEKEKKFYNSLSYEVFQSHFCPDEK